MTARSGMVLIVVAGLAAIIGALTLAFLEGTRSDAEESAAYLRGIQARIMLTAGLEYLSETARIGWDDDAPDTEHPQAFGWRDIRDGRPGPRDILGRGLFGGDPVTGVGDRFPAVRGQAARCDMYVPQRAPFALTRQAPIDPVQGDPATTWRELLSYARPDPQPATADPIAFRRGDPTPRPPTVGLAWFRCWRADLDVFIVTCGAGGTHGYRSYDEAVAAGDGAMFCDAESFAEIRRAETVLWYQTQWSPAVAGSHYWYNRSDGSFELNGLGEPGTPSTANANSRNFLGSFAYIRRLLAEPAEW